MFLCDASPDLRHAAVDLPGGSAAVPAKPRLPAAGPLDRAAGRTVGRQPAPRPTPPLGLHLPSRHPAVQVTPEKPIRRLIRKGLDD